MIGRALLRLANLPALVRYLRSHRADRSMWDPAKDLELELYGAIFGNDFLHYGYFDPIPDSAEEISMGDVKRAMDAYATLLVSRVQPGERVLDVGCGMGGLLSRLDAAGARPAGLTPNRAHAAHIRERWPHLPLVEGTLEAADSPLLAEPFPAIVSAESFQYVDLEQGLARIGRLLAPGGRWIVIDYDRLQADTRNKSGHLLADFEAAVGRHGMEIVERVDVTEHCIPSLAYGRLLATRFVLPLARFGAERLLLRERLLSYLLGDEVRRKLNRVRLDTLDPDVFRREKRYLLFTIQRRG
jgi:SAM-dependent methyltransferase